MHSKGIDIYIRNAKLSSNVLWLFIFNINSIKMKQKHFIIYQARDLLFNLKKSKFQFESKKMEASEMKIQFFD